MNHCLTFNCRPGFNQHDQFLGLNFDWSRGDSTLIPFLRQQIQSAINDGIREFKFQLPTGKYRWEVEQPIVTSSRFPVGRLKNLKDLFDSFRSQYPDIVFTLRSGLWFSAYDNLTGQHVHFENNKAFWPINLNRDNSTQTERALDYLAGMLEGLQGTFDGIDFDALGWLKWDLVYFTLEGLFDRLPAFKFLGGELPQLKDYDGNWEWLIKESNISQRTRWMIKNINRLDPTLYNTKNVWVFDNNNTSSVISKGVNLDYWSFGYNQNVATAMKIGTKGYDQSNYTS